MVSLSSLDPGLCGPAGSGLSQGLTLAVEELTRLLSWGFHDLMVTSRGLN